MQRSESRSLTNGAFHQEQTLQTEVDDAVGFVKNCGLFDNIRKHYLDVAQNKDGYEQLLNKVDSNLTQLLNSTRWTPDLNKNKFRDALKKEKILRSKSFETQLDDLVVEVINKETDRRFVPHVSESMSKISSAKDNKEVPNELRDKNRRTNEKLKVTGHEMEMRREEIGRQELLNKLLGPKRPEEFSGKRERALVGGKEKLDSKVKCENNSVFRYNESFTHQTSRRNNRTNGVANE